MNKLNFKKVKAFTLAETVITCCVIAAIAIITACTTLNSEAVSDKKIKVSSMGLYNELSSAYSTILFNKTNNFNIKKLRGADYSNINRQLKTLMFDHMDLNEASCRKLPINSIVSNYSSFGLSENSFANGENCASSPKGYAIAFFLETQGNQIDCENSYQVKDYWQGSLDLKTVENACGFILFSIKNSKGIMGKDLFAIALGANGVK